MLSNAQRAGAQRPIQAWKQGDRAIQTFRAPLAPRRAAPASTPGAPRRLGPPAAKAAAAAAEAVFEATGVPMVDALMKMSSVEAAAQHSIRMVVAAAVGVVVGSIVLSAVDRLAGGKLAAHADQLNLPAAAVASVLQPTQVLLPFYGLAYAATVASSLAQVAAIKMKSEFATLCCGRGDEVLTVLKTMTQLLQDTSELVLIIGGAWAAISFKDKIMAWLTAVLSKDGASNNIVVQLMRPLSSILSAFVYFAAVTTALSAYGVNVGPLVASVGGVGLAVGLATQSVAQNVVAAISLYSGGPFLAGDTVELWNGGGVLVAAGVVEVVEPLCTTIRGADGSPVYVSNADVASCVVKNLSRKRA